MNEREGVCKKRTSSWKVVGWEPIPTDADGFGIQSLTTSNLQEMKKKEGLGTERRGRGRTGTS